MEIHYNSHIRKALLVKSLELLTIANSLLSITNKKRITNNHSLSQSLKQPQATDRNEMSINKYKRSK